MTFVEMLRAARVSRVSVLHEFWTQYDQTQKRLHLFFEGHDDAIFFRHFVDRHVQANFRIFMYRCDGKARVFEAFNQIVQRYPGAKSVLFFVDKDIDDILGTPWPTDPRIFVTDVYSIENYLSTRNVIERFYRDAVKLSGVDFDEETIFGHFSRQRARFHRMMISVMAWIILLRRTGARPNLNNINLSEVYELSADCRICSKDVDRMAYLARVADAPARAFRQILPIARDLARMPTERIVRGKFDAWFVVAFWKGLAGQLEALAREGGGKVMIKSPLERSTVVATLTAYAEIPRSLKLFLSAHLALPVPPPQPARTPQESLARRAFAALLRALGARKY